MHTLLLLLPDFSLILLGAMMCFDLGGPVNKAAYTFATGLIGSFVGGLLISLLGLLDVKTSVYAPEMDFSAKCRRP